MVRGAPPEAEVIAEFLGVIGDSDYVAAHNIAFDRKFLAESVERNGLTWPSGKRRLCSLELAQANLKRGTKEGMVKNHRLGTLIEHFGYEHGSAHRALDDTRAGARVLNELLVMLAKAEEASDAQE
jgi:DNA polymerase III epsilon subunit-like protein